MDTEKLHMNLLNALENLKKDLQCSSCHKQAHTPVTLRNCDHMFCSVCIQHRTRCPICDMPAWAQDQMADRRLESISNLCFQLEGHLSCMNTEENSPNNSASCTTSSESDEAVSKKQRKVTKEVSRKRNSASSTDSSMDLKRTNSKKAMKREISFPVHPTRKNDKANKENKTGLKAGTPKLTLKRCMPKNSRGETPLHLAAMQGKIDEITALLKKNADVNAKDNAGWTPLHEACNQGHLDIAEKLLDAGALIDVPGYENDTPLIDAVSNNQLVVVQLLLKRGANVNLRNAAGKTALNMARTDAMISALEAHLTQDSAADFETQLTVSKPDYISVFFQDAYDTKKVKGLRKLLNANQSLKPAMSTHFIVTSCPDLKIKRNLKYLQAMAFGSWVLSDSWVEKCLQMKKWTSEQSFLIKGAYEDQFVDGPLRSVSARLKCVPRLFDGCHFFLYGNFSFPLPNKIQLTDLLKLSGGQMLSREPKHDNDIVQSCRNVPYHAIPDTPQYYFTYYIVYDPSQKYLPRSIRIGKVCTVSASWVLDCISQFRICDVS